MGIPFGKRVGLRHQQRRTVLCGSLDYQTAGRRGGVVHFPTRP